MQLLVFFILFEPISNILLLLFSHLADAFIQSDLQMRTTEAINCSIKTTKTDQKLSLNFINTIYIHI